MRIGSLFSGVGGYELGLCAAIPGARVVWQCEIDPFCRRVLARHWPAVPIYEDITTLEEVPPVDLICGGFPCQDISIAGKGAGINGTKSGLFFELMRIVRLAGHPKWICLENVPALASRGMGAVLGELAQSGYDAEWSVFGADDLGAPHRRKRIWIIAWRRDVADTNGPQRKGNERSFRVTPEHANTGGTGWWAHQPPMGRVADGFPGRVDRLRALGNAIVPACAYQVGLRVAELSRHRQP